MYLNSGFEGNVLMPRSNRHSWLGVRVNFSPCQRICTQIAPLTFFIEDKIFGGGGAIFELYSWVGHIFNIAFRAVTYSIYTHAAKCNFFFVPVRTGASNYLISILYMYEGLNLTKTSAVINPFMYMHTHIHIQVHLI